MAGSLEEYLTYLKHRPRWFNNRRNLGKPISQSYLETNYRRLYRFFNWMVERGRIGRNPLKLIPHPHVDEKVVPLVPLDEFLAMLLYRAPADAKGTAERFRALRNSAVLLTLWDTPGRLNEIARIEMSVAVRLAAILHECYINNPTVS